MVCTSKTLAHKYTGKVGDQTIHPGKALCIPPVTTLVSHGEEKGREEPVCCLCFPVDVVLHFQDIWKSCLKKNHSGYISSNLFFRGLYLTTQLMIAADLKIITGIQAAPQDMGNLNVSRMMACGLPSISRCTATSK